MKIVCCNHTAPFGISICYVIHDDNQVCPLCYLEEDYSERIKALEEYIAVLENKITSKER